MSPTHPGSQPGVVIYRPVDAAGESHRRLLDAGCRVYVAGPEEDLDTALGRPWPVQALLCASIRGGRIDRARLARLPELRIVAKYTIGVDDVDLEAATAAGVLVTHCTTEANYGGVAEGTIALMLALLKKLAARDLSVRSGGWRSAALQGTYLGAREDGYRGITLGVIGFGRIGRRVADLLRPWKIEILATDPYVEAEVFMRHGARSVPLEELLARSDVVSLHCQLTHETEGLLDRQALRRMKPSAILINTARGRIVDVEAVCDALDAAELGGAAFDVLPEEPPPPAARILHTDERVILSPHMVAANQGGTLGAAVPWATEAVLDALAGQLPQRIYNGAAIEAWRARFAGKSLL